MVYYDLLSFWVGDINNRRYYSRKLYIGIRTKNNDNFLCLFSWKNVKYINNYLRIVNKAYLFLLVLQHVQYVVVKVSMLATMAGSYKQ